MKSMLVQPCLHDKKSSEKVDNKTKVDIEEKAHSSIILCLENSDRVMGC